MKKALFMMAAAVLMFSAACTKDEEDAPAGKNTWTLNGTVHTVAYTNKSQTSGGTPTTLFIFADASYNDPKLNTFNLSFKTAPTTSGTYQLRGTVGDDLIDKQFELFAGNATAAFAYIGETIDVKIDVADGKIKLTIPEISLKNAQGGADGKFTATVSEK